MSETKTKSAVDCDVDCLNSMLRGEIAAVDTYEQVLRKFEGAEEPEAENMLAHIRDEHSAAVKVLRDCVVTAGGIPSENAGVWGVFAGTFTAGAKLIGTQTALAALKQGEHHGIEQYGKTLENEELSDECSDAVSNELLPRCRRHVEKLDQMIDKLENSPSA